MQVDHVLFFKPLEVLFGIFSVNFLCYHVYLMQTTIKLFLVFLFLPECEGLFSKRHSKRNARLL